MVVDLCQNPDDPTRVALSIINYANKLNPLNFSSILASVHIYPHQIVFPIGHVVCWNLQQKTSESVYTLQQVIVLIKKKKSDIYIY